MKNQDSNKSMIARKSKFMKAFRASELGKLILDINMMSSKLMDHQDNFLIISSVLHEKRCYSKANNEKSRP